MKIFKIAISLLLILMVIAVFPVFNGRGCDSVFDVDDPSFTISGSGRCERGHIDATLINKETHDAYKINGNLAIIGNQFFIFVNEISFVQKSDKIHDELRRYKYFRNVISGKIVNEKYILMYTPQPRILLLKITGDISHF